MNLYTKTNGWKLILIGLGFDIYDFTAFYSNYLAKNFLHSNSAVKLFETTLIEITNTANLNEDVTYEMDILKNSIMDLQVVSINRNNEIEFYNFFPENTDTLKLFARAKTNGPPPVISDDYTISITDIQKF